MSLIDVTLAGSRVALPSDVRALLAEADRRIERFQHESPVPAFVPSDFVGAYHALRAITDQDLAAGRLFCEWGSGFGVTTCLASLLEFEACGIEIEAELVAEARRLAEDFDITAEFMHGSFIPLGARLKADATDGFNWLDRRESNAGEELGLEIDEFDVIFAYPWPDEEPVIGELFERFAGEKALLVTYHSGAEYRVRRKARRGGRRGR